MLCWVLDGSEGGGFKLIMDYSYVLLLTLTLSNELYAIDPTAIGTIHTESGCCNLGKQTTATNCTRIISVLVTVLSITHGYKYVLRTAENRADLTGKLMLSLLLSSYSTVTAILPSTCI